MQVPPDVIAARALGAEIAAYRGMVEAHAFRFSRLPEMENDYDDLVQEGLISVMESFQAEEYPSNVVVENAMRDWARTRRRQLRGSTQLPEDDLAP